MKSLDKVLNVFETLAANADKELSLSELSDLTGLAPSTTLRILSKLVKRGYVIQKKKRGKYTLNNTFIVINLEDKYYKTLRQISAPYLIKLGNKIKENLFLTVQAKNDTITIATVDTKNILNTYIEIGTKAPMYCTAAGKIFLANSTESELVDYLKHVELRGRNPNTITDASHLRSSLKLIEEKGVAYDDEEMYLGIRVVAVPIRNAEGKVMASLGVMGPAIRLTREKMSTFLPDIKSCAAEISEAIISHNIT